MKNLLRIEINQDRIFGLDILRALAILFVLVSHTKLIIPTKLYNILCNFFLDGVLLFFVLSGFLIGGILIKTFENKTINTKTLLNFWIKRWLRTLPNYYLILIILILIQYQIDSSFRIYNYKRYFIFSQNLFSPHPYYFSEAWSLSVEEWFYLLIPIIIFLLIKIFKFSVKNTIFSTAIFIIVSVTMFRYFRYTTLTVNTLEEWDVIYRKQVFTRLDSLMFGVIGAYLNHYYNFIWKKFKVVLFITGVVMHILLRYNKLNYPDPSFYQCVFYFTLTSIATLITLPYFNSIKTGKGLFFKSITYISLISYSLYLVNATLVHTLINILNVKFLNKLDYKLHIISDCFLFFFLSFTISIIIYKYFEYPIMKLRDKIKI